MDEFIKQNYGFIAHGVEFLAAVVGLIFYEKYRLTAVKYFILFLIYLSVCDFINLYTLFVKPDEILDFLEGTVFEKNYWWATSYWNIGAILFFSFFYNKILKGNGFKKFIKISTYIFLIFSLIYIALNKEEFFVRFFPIISILGAIIIFQCAVFYFIEILRSDKILTFYKSMNFYISLAIFIWWLIITPIVFYDVYYSYDIEKSFKDWDFVILRREIYLFSNIFMYLTYTFALIWCKPEND